MVDSCSGKNILVLLTENMSILTAHYYAISNFQSWKSPDLD